MATSKSKAVAKVASQEELAEVAQQFPGESSTFQSILLPRLELVSQDQTEEVRNPKTGKKEIKINTEAGTFQTAKQGEETDEATGKKLWVREEIGTKAEGIILFQRKQLKFYDGEKYTSSPVYDDDREVLPLFRDGEKVDEGTPAELKAREIYQGKSAKGKDVSKLEDNRVVYVLYNDEVYQLNLRGTSMYAYMKYCRTVTPNTVVTGFDSIAKEQGTTKWNQMTFDIVRKLTSDEVLTVKEKLAEIQQGIVMQKSHFAAQAAGKSQADKDFEALGDGE